MDHFFDRLLFNLLPTGVLVVAVYGAIWGPDGLFARERLRADLAREEHHLEQLDAENARLRREIRELASDPTTLTRAAVEDLQLAPPGSTIYHFR